MFDLYGRYAHRYDLHTPPDHYQHDHQLVLGLAAEVGLPCRLLDVGCGTGVLLEKARAAGIDAQGLDASPEMIAVARERVPSEALRVLRMQNLEDRGTYDMIVSLSWSIHYCSGPEELRCILSRTYEALRPRGSLLLQVAHGPHASSDPWEDVEVGPSGVSEDVSLRVGFHSRREPPLGLEVEYAYHCASAGESFAERHVLEVADIHVVRALVEEVGFRSIQLWNSWRRDPFGRSVSPFVWAQCP
jgi:SAM-dependent methyltransferase